MSLPGTAAVEKAYQGGNIILRPFHQPLQFHYVPDGLYLHKRQEGKNRSPTPYLSLRVFKQMVAPKEKQW